MMITTLKSKIAYAKVTEANLFYEGSITIDQDLMDEARILPNEQVHIVNVNNGERLITYAIPGERGSKVICLNGPAARKALVDDLIIILTYVSVDPDKETIEPAIIQCPH